MSCAFAENAFYEYWSASSGDPTQSEDIDVWSTEGQSFYTLTCTPGDGVIDCVGYNDSGTSLDARFSQTAVTAYTIPEADTYANSGKLGP